MKKTLCMPAALAWLFAAAGTLAAEVPLEVYARLPTVANMAISPDGDRVAFRRTDATMDAMFVLDGQTVLGVVDGSKTKLRDISFLDQDRLVLFARESELVNAAATNFEISGSFLFDLRTRELSKLLERSRHVYPLQEGIGRIVGHNPQLQTIYMPAFIGDFQSTATPYGLLEVTVENPGGRVVTPGTSDTIDWFVDTDGSILAEEEYDKRKDVQRIWGRREGKRVLVYESDATRPVYGIVGLSRDSRSLVVSGRGDNEEFNAYFEMSLEDGSVGPPLFARTDAGIERPLVDLHRRVQGVQYSGFFPRYEFFDPGLTDRVKAVQAAMKTTAAYLVDWTPDFRNLLFRLDGGWTSGAYVVVRPGSSTPTLLANIREEIPGATVAPSRVVSYEARDGLEIPALVTALDDVRAAGKAPLIVLPHGGPTSHDRFGFDWFVQYFASRGIVVLQPQFRGSTGFGATLRQAGEGQWGRSMSTDLDDGVKHFIDAGLADPARVCMVGFSYGGYAALAAGAFSPFDYKCLVSVAGVSDLPRMLESARELYGHNSSTVSAMQEQLGSKGKLDKTLDAVSPVNFADRFRAPVLLVHGRNDAVVLIDQSLRMEKALRRAKKPVQLVRLKGEDHYLSGYQTRQEALRAVAGFIEEQL